MLSFSCSIPGRASGDVALLTGGFATIVFPYRELLYVNLEVLVPAVSTFRMNTYLTEGYMFDIPSRWTHRT